MFTSSDAHLHGLYNYCYTQFIPNTSVCKRVVGSIVYSEIRAAWNLYTFSMSTVAVLQLSHRINSMNVSATA